MGLKFVKVYVLPPVVPEFPLLALAPPPPPLLLSFRFTPLLTASPAAPPAAGLGGILSPLNGVSGSGLLVKSGAIGTGGGDWTTGAACPWPWP